MIIVSGWLRVAAETREVYLGECRSVVEAARFAPAPDPLDPEGINVFEQWQTVDAVERFRASGPSDSQRRTIIGAELFQHEIASSSSLT